MEESYVIVPHGDASLALLHSVAPFFPSILSPAEFYYDRNRISAIRHERQRRPDRTLFIDHLLTHAQQLDRQSPILAHFLNIHTTSSLPQPQQSIHPPRTTPSAPSSPPFSPLSRSSNPRPSSTISFSPPTLPPLLATPKPSSSPPRTDNPSPPSSPPTTTSTNAPFPSSLHSLKPNSSTKLSPSSARYRQSMNERISCCRIGG